MSYLSLDDAAERLGVNRKTLSSSISLLNIKTTRISRRSYLATSDVDAIRSFRDNDEKSNPVYSGMITYANTPEAKSPPRNYKAYVREGYHGDPTLFKVVNYIIQNGAAIPPQLYTDKTRQKTIDSHPLLDKLDEPNNEQTGVEYREAVLGYTLLAGNSYQYAIRLKKSGPPDELWCLSPDAVKPVVKKPLGIIGYNYDAYDDTKNPIPTELIGRIKNWNPDDDTFGMSQVEPGAILIDANSASRKWNLALLQNYARMPGAWVVPTAMAKNERDKLEEKLKEKMRGYANAGTPPVLDAGLSWQNMAVAPTEMDWLESIRRNAGDIANLYNIPPQLIGDTSASTYSNLEEAKEASYTEAIFPYLDKMYALWTKWLLPMYGLKGANLYYDKKSVEVIQKIIQAQKQAIADRAVKAWLQGAITMNEAREMMELPPIPGGDVFRFGAVLVRASELDKYAEQSLAAPAAPPFPQPEPLNAPTPTDPNAPQGNEPQQQNTPPAPTKPAKPATKPSDAQEAPPPKKSIVLHTRAKKASSGDVTHMGWECMPGACEFCMENDGVVVAIGEDFPNGCSSPDDCHNHCKCQGYELAIPDDANTDGLSLTALAAMFAVGFIMSKHDKEDQARQQEPTEDYISEDFADEEDNGKAINLLERRQRREDYREFMLKSLK